MIHPVEARWKFQDATQLQLFSAPTPNGIKIAAALEELALPYEPHRVDIGAGDQHTPEYLLLSPNGKIPTLLDPGAPGGPLAIMESGAILIHLADKAGKLIPAEAAGRSRCLQWLFFQVGHVGPMFGQFGHFYKFAREACDHPYPLDRYRKETMRLLEILERQLSEQPYLVGADYTIADIATWPWVRGLEFYGAMDELGVQRLEHVWDWYQRCATRPASERAKRVNAGPA